MSEYQKLDELILECIRTNGAPVKMAVLGASVWNEARALAGDDASRAIDRRLQALRKAGKIRHSWAHKKIGWVLAC